MALGYNSSNLGTTGYNSSSLFGKDAQNTLASKLEADTLVVDSGNSSSLGSLVGNVNTTSNKDYERLYTSMGEDLADILLKYSTGEFDDIAEYLEDSTYGKIKLAINNQLSTVDDPFFDIYKTTFQQMLDGLKRTAYQYIEYIQMIRKLEEAQEKLAILEDPSQLQAYINQYYRDNTLILFDLPDITTTEATVRPEIQEYIRLYGVPDNLDFDEVKLQAIIDKLNR